MRAATVGMLSLVAAAGSHRSGEQPQACSGLHPALQPSAAPPTALTTPQKAVATTSCFCCSRCFQSHQQMEETVERLVFRLPVWQQMHQFQVLRDQQSVC